MFVSSHVCTNDLTRFNSCSCMYLFTYRRSKWILPRWQKKVILPRSISNEIGVITTDYIWIDCVLFCLVSGNPVDGLDVLVIDVLSLFK